MSMKKILLSLTILAALLASCSQSEQDKAKEYNNIVTRYSNESLYLYDSLKMILNISTINRDFKAIVPLAAITTDSIRKNIERVKSQQAPEYSDDYRNTMIAFMTSLADASTAFEKIAHIRHKTPKTKADSIVSNIISARNRADSMLTVAQKAQNEFLNSYNIPPQTLISPPESIDVSDKLK